MKVRRLCPWVSLLPQNNFSLREALGHGGSQSGILQAEKATLVEVLSCISDCTPGGGVIVGGTGSLLVCQALCEGAIAALHTSTHCLHNCFPKERQVCFRVTFFKKSLDH